MKSFIVQTPENIESESLREALYHSPTPNGYTIKEIRDIPWAEDSPDSNVRNDHGEIKVRMTVAQRDALWELSHRYNVPFREDDYQIHQVTGIFGQKGWAEGWIGGPRHNGHNNMRTTLYVGVSPEGQINS